MIVLTRCSRCRSVLSPWEVGQGGCACRRPNGRNNADALYALACSAETPLPVHDYVRLAKQDLGAFMTKSTAEATIAPDQRFCWAGPGTYGLYRHGVLPGPRKLEECARMLLVATGPLHMEAVSFVLKQLGYRFADGSLRNAIAKSWHIKWDQRVWTHPNGEAARLRLRREIPVVPPRQRSQFEEIMHRLNRAAARALTTRERRRASVPITVSQFVAPDWEDG